MAEGSLLGAIANPYVPEISLGQAMQRAQQLQMGRIKIDDAMSERSSLADYNARLQGGDANPEQALGRHPALMAQVLQARAAVPAARQAEFDERVGRLAKSAQAVAGITDPTEQLTAWNSELDGLKKSGLIDENRYRQLYGKVNSLVLNNAIAGGLAIAPYLKHEQEKGAVDIAGQFGRAFSGVMGGGSTAPAPAPPGGGAPGPMSSGRATLIKAESGGDPARINQFGYVGLKQFGAPRLADLGVYTPGEGENIKAWSKSPRDAPGKWTGQFNIPGYPGVRTVGDFLRNPGAQEAVDDIHREKIGTEIRENGLDRYLGTTIGSQVITEQGLENAIHLAGAGGTRRYLESGGKANVRDANGTSVADYLRLGGGAAGAAGPTMANVPGPVGEVPHLRQLAGMAMQVLAHPGMPEGMKLAAKEIVDWAKKEAEPTPDQKEYMGHWRQEIQAGRVPERYKDFVKDLHESKRQVVNIDQRAESAAEVERKGGLAKQLNAMAESYGEAHDQREMFGRLGNLLEQSGSGTGVAFTNWVRSNTGISLNKNAGVAEGAQALISYLKPRMRVAGSGASSDRDMNEFGKALPGLLSTEDGRRIATETLGGMQQARIDRAEIAQRWQTGDIDDKQALKEVRALTNPFKSFREWQEKVGGRAGVQTREVPVFGSPDDMRAAVKEKRLTIGDPYRTQDGRYGTVKTEDME